MPLCRSGPLVVLMFCGCIFTTGCGSGGMRNSSSPPPTKSNPPPTIDALSLTPATVSIDIGATQQMTANAMYSNGTSANVTTTAVWQTANPSIATVTLDGTIAAVSAGTTSITASLGGQKAMANLNVGANILTWHGDNSRSGLNAGEGVLTPQNVSPQGFGKLYSWIVDGYIYAQPLFVSNLSINGALHDVVFVATENDSVYAFEADQFSPVPLWQVSLLQSGETPATTDTIQPYTGITSTPAIDLNSNTIYVVSMQTSSSSGATYRLNALDITSGNEKSGGAITLKAQVPGTNSDSVNGVVFLPNDCVQRAALLIADGSVFIGFGSCHSGWLLAYNEETLAQTGVFNASPNLNGEGTYGGAGGVWMGGGGPAADSNGNIFVTTGNGPYDGQTAFGDSVLKFDPNLNLLDHFTPFDYQYMDCSDSDLAAGGLLLIPGSTEALGGGKMGKLYLVNTSALGGEQPNDAGATQTLWFESDLISPYDKSCTDSLGTHTAEVNSYQIFASSAYFNNSIYLGVTPSLVGVPGPLRQFSFNGTLTPGAYTSDSILPSSYGTTPFISAAGNSAGIVWMIDHGDPIQTSAGTTAVLRAFDASNVSTELYDSSENPSDSAGYGIKFTSPIVANGKVFIGTAHDTFGTPNPRGELDVYGLRN